MFGLMKYYRCSSTEEERKRYRQHYCGVCKTLAKLYGQHTRFLLNRDLVFLSELLAAISGEPQLSRIWNIPVFRLRHCFRLPRNKEEISLCIFH